MKRPVYLTPMLLLLVCLTLPRVAWPAGSVSQSIAEISKGVFEVTLICVGDSSDGSIPNTVTTDANQINSKIRGGYLYSVIAFPTVGGTAPDAASVFIIDKYSLYLLGSEDGGTTAYDGLNLIHATLTRKAKPNIYSPRAGLHLYDYPKITGALTLKVSDQATLSAEWTIVYVVIAREK